MEQKTKVIIVGGGFAGAFTARAIEKLASKTFDIELISDRNYFVFQPLLPEVAAGTINVQDAVTPLRQLLKGTKVRLGEVRDIDFSSKTVQIAQGSKRIPAFRSYDHLVLAVGQRTVLDRFPGFAEHSFCMRDVSNAHSVRNHVIQCLEHADVTENETLRKRLLTFVVAGAGFSGVEIAGELNEMLARTLRQYPRLKPADLKTVLVQRGDRILPELPESLGAYAAEKLNKHGVEILYGTSLERATGTAVYTSKGECIPTQTLITTVGNGPLKLVEKLGLPLERGRIVVDSCMRVSGQDNVWALGDAALVPTDEQGGVSPTTAQYALRQASTLAKNIVATVKDLPPRPFSYNPRGSMASIGHYRGVAELFGVRVSGLLAWLIWRAFYIGMLPGFSTRLRVALNWLFDYFLPRSIVQVKTEASASASRVHYSKGDELFGPGQIVDGFYIVVEGALESRVPNSPEEDFVRHLKPGDHWGERSLSEGRTTSGTLTAIEDSQVLFLRADDFTKLKEGLPPLSDYLSQIPEKIYAPLLRRE